MCGNECKLLQMKAWFWVQGYCQMHKTVFTMWDGYTMASWYNLGAKECTECNDIAYPFRGRVLNMMC